MHDHLRTADMSVFYMRDYVNYLKRLNDLDRAFLAPFSRADSYSWGYGRFSHRGRQFFLLIVVTCNLSYPYSKQNT